MTLDQLRVFVAVAEREHMTRAAADLHITQSAASAAIAALESRHDARLFHRVGRGIALTDAGRAFLPEARAVLARAAGAAAVLHDVAGLARGTLRIAASQTIGGYWLPPRLAAFHRRYPAIELVTMIANTHDVADRVRDGRADLGLVEGEIDDPALARWRVGEDRMQLVQAPPAPHDIDAAWLQAAPWVIREPGSGTRDVLTAALAAHGIDATPIVPALILPSNEAIRSAVEAGAGIAGLSSLVVEPSIAAGRLVTLPFDFAPRSFFALCHKERYRSRAADAFVDLLTAPDLVPSAS